MFSLQSFFKGKGEIARIEELQLHVRKGEQVFADCLQAKLFKINEVGKRKLHLYCIQ
jgi:hypothetical protein